MKKAFIIISVCICSVSIPQNTSAQVTELMQLALNVEKLLQFKQILSDLKKGYEIISGGYKTIKNISEGNFKLHQAFLDGLTEVSPAVKKYHRIADIINCQILLIKEYKSALKRFKSSQHFDSYEVEYISDVHGNLVSLSLKNLEDLITVTTAKKLRMSDDERISSIDNIYADMQDKLQFLRSFNNNMALLALQRDRESKDVERVKEYYDLK